LRIKGFIEKVANTANGRCKNQPHLPKSGLLFFLVYERRFSFLKLLLHISERLASEQKEGILKEAMVA
jgi:hypothetical protein